VASISALEAVSTALVHRNTANPLCYETVAATTALTTGPRQSHLCYKLQMPKTIERWLLFKYIGGEFTPLSKPLKKREEAEKARLKYPERERKMIGIGIIRTKS
jgi:hypothetical protein